VPDTGDFRVIGRGAAVYRDDAGESCMTDRSGCVGPGPLLRPPEERRWPQQRQWPPGRPAQRGPVGGSRRLARRGLGSIDNEVDLTPVGVMSMMPPLPAAKR
jgi:hypothetical protein